MPKKLNGVVNYKFLILTRLGEGLFRYQALAGAEKFLHGKGDGVRRRMLSSVESVATRQLRLPELGLVPDGTFEDIARSTVSLATDGFYEAIADGRISVLKDNTVRGSSRTTEGRSPNSPTVRPFRPTWWCAAPASGSRCRSSTRGSGSSSPTTGAISRCTARSCRTTYPT
jgi:hypothetical protein